MFPRQLGALATAEALVFLATIHTLGCMKGCAIYAGCMVNRYFGGIFYPPTHHGTNVVMGGYRMLKRVWVVICGYGML